MSTMNRWILTEDGNGVDPTGFSKGDSPTMMRKCATKLDACAQGTRASKLWMAYAPIAAQAKITATGNGSGSDYLTIGNTRITLEASGANLTTQVNVGNPTAGTSVSAAAAATTGTFSFFVNINGDGPQLITVTSTTGAGMATAIQTALQALTANTSYNAVAYSSATCSYGSTQYTITSGKAGSISSVVVTPQYDGAKTLSLGIIGGGTETTGNAGLCDNLASLINTSTNAWAGMVTAKSYGTLLILTSAIPGTIGNGLQAKIDSCTALTLTTAFGAETAGTEGTSYTFKLGI